MRSLVTGGAGFIGSTLVDRLRSRGDRVLVVDNLSRGTERHLADALADGTTDLEAIDVRSTALTDLVAAFQPEVVFHLAAQIDVRISVADPLADADVNILGTINVARAARAAGVRKVVFASSGGAIYGATDALPISEQHPVVPMSPYACSKLGGEHILLVDPAVTDPIEVDREGVDLVIAESTDRTADIGHDGAHVVVSDAPTLERACETVRRVPWTVLTFTDPTKIPLEIVIAAAENSGGRTITTVTDIEDAGIVKLVLEHGSDGLLLAPRNADDVLRIAQITRAVTPSVALVEFEVTGVEHIGMGDRACIDTCSLLEKDEGCLIGSFSKAMFLSCSETHPLPYMPTRPFRWNAGAVHSYVLGPENRTRYVSELQAGFPILAVRSDGSVREVRIGRVKIEKRPLLSITARTPDGQTANVITQDDWHVRLLGPGGSVNNVTELKPGDRLLGYVPTEARHVGLPITEFCDER